MRIFSAVVLGTLALACACWAVVALVRGQYLTSLAALSGAVFWLAPPAASFLMPNVVAWGRTTTEGTTIRADNRLEALLLVAMTSGLLAVGALGTLGFMNKLPFSLPPDMAPISGIVFFGPAAGFLVALGLIARNRGSGYIRLTPDGFKFVEFFSTTTGDWAEVIAVTNEVSADVIAPSPLVMVMANDERRMIKQSAIYTPGGQAILQFVQFYLHQPQLRSELTDGRATERLQAVQLRSRYDQSV
ncbi:hypothetical protein A5761_28575 [Mycolicibacterium setense]|nr:hypothetical protein A5761_28575 [Mycolicibacterium setense]